MRGLADIPAWALPVDPRSGARWGSAGRYVVDRQLGSGGMGTVYAATDTLLGRQVALKVLHRSEGDDGSKQSRMLREARLAAQVEHERIARVYDVDEHEGQLFVAMEFVRGMTLRARMRSGALEAAEIVSIAVQIAEGLAELHALGLIHRDLKPENVMLTGAGGVKILDFGLARQVMGAEGGSEPASPDHPRSDGHISLSGTPGYMAPERFEGGALDYRVDVFALGVIVYELVAGARPFGDGRPYREQGAPARAPSYAGTRWRRMSHLKGVTARMLAPDPRRRIPDGAQALAALRQLAFRASGAYARSERPAGASSDAPWPDDRAQGPAPLDQTAGRRAVWAPTIEATPVEPVQVWPRASGLAAWLQQARSGYRLRLAWTAGCLAVLGLSVAWGARLRLRGEDRVVGSPAADRTAEAVFGGQAPETEGAQGEVGAPPRVQGAADLALAADASECVASPPPEVVLPLHLAPKVPTRRARPRPARPAVTTGAEPRWQGAPSRR